VTLILGPLIGCGHGTVVGTDTDYVQGVCAGIAAVQRVATSVKPTTTGPGAQAAALAALAPAVEAFADTLAHLHPPHDVIATNDALIRAARQVATALRAASGPGDPLVAVEQFRFPSVVAARLQVLAAKNSTCTANAVDFTQAGLSGAN
jgi:hypothetical protein